jgi:transporter family-2 protein
MQFLFLLFAIVAGMTSALQSGANNTLQKSLNTPLWTVAIVSMVTMATSLVLAIGAGERFPSGSTMAQTPWWAWIGGLFGIVFVLATVFASPKLGAGVFVALIVTASTVTSLVLDHFGLMSFDVHPAGIGRIAGALLMVAGVALVAYF